ncbi:MAG TPA: isoprenylcysteine carboxylmethyltransferase family protein [Burkholderiales bacterium]
MIAFLYALYGLGAYFLFAGTFVYAVCFAGNFAVPKTIDSGAAGPLGEALVVDLLLLGVFAAQHSVMARRGFKRWWTRIVPPAAARSTYVLFSSLALALILWQWRPIPQPVLWSLQGGAATASWAVFWLGWAILFGSSFMINHFELFGLSQVFSRAAGGEVAAPQFRTPLLYRYVRHPIYFGFLLGFWATPVMTAGHLLFAAGSTAYILVGVWFEERDLVAQFGEQYRRYRRQVSMLIPLPRGREAGGEAGKAD